MKILKTVLLVLVALIALLAVVSLFLPSTYEVERRIAIEAPPARIHEVVGDLHTWPEWTAWSREAYPDLVFEWEGPPGEAGEVYRWRSEETGNGELEVTATHPEKGLWYDLRFEEFPPSKGAIRYEPSAGGETVVVWSDRGSWGENPLMRWFGVMIDSMLGAQLEEGLENLERRIEGGEEG